ncbi:hypothetical protein C8R46DRAFT_1096159, partial [Mycena filopes]
ESRANKAAQSKARRDKKSSAARRRVLRERQNENNLVVEQQEDSEVVKELRAALARTRGERDAAEAAAARPASPLRGPTPRSIARPNNMSKVTVADIRDHLGLAGSENDQMWSSLRTSIRRFMHAGMLEMDQSWKAQDTRRLIKVYDAIEEAHPDLERFRGQWATAFLKTYKNCKGKDGTYRARNRQDRLAASRLRRVEDGGFGGDGPRAPDHTLDRSASPPVRTRASGSARLRSLTPLSDENQEPGT